MRATSVTLLNDTTLTFRRHHTREWAPKGQGGIQKRGDTRRAQLQCEGKASATRDCNLLEPNRIAADMRLLSILCGYALMWVCAYSWAEAECILIAGYTPVAGHALIPGQRLGVYLLLGMRPWLGVRFPGRRLSVYLLLDTLVAGYALIPGRRLGVYLWLGIHPWPAMRLFLGKG
jgi:hypothetical protein